MERQKQAEQQQHLLQDRAGINAMKSGDLLQSSTNLILFPLKAYK